MALRSRLDVLVARQPTQDMRAPNPARSANAMQWSQALTCFAAVAPIDPAHERRERFDVAADRPNPQRFASDRARQSCALADRGGKNIGRHHERESDDR